MRRTCDECGDSYVYKKPSSKFCSTGCRKTWNNRRAQRGTLFYDAIMNMRYDRKSAASAGIDFTFICRIGELFNDQDKGRSRTFRRAAEVIIDKGCVINSRRMHCTCKKEKEKTNVCN